MHPAIGNSRTTTKALWAMLLLGLLWAAGALRPELLPAQSAATIPPLTSQALSLGLSAIALCLIWLRRPESPVCPPVCPQVCPQVKPAIWIGLSLFTAPAIAIHFASSGTSPYTRIALFALVPVFSIVLDPYLGSAGARPIPGSLAASMAALLGAALVFPVTMPNSIEAAGALATVIVATMISAAANCYAVAVFQATEARRGLALAAIVTLAGAASLGTASLLLEYAPAHAPVPSLAWASQLLSTAVIELPGLLLLFWLMRRISAVRLSARFLLGPALAVSLGAFLFQTSLAPRTSLGLLALAGGAAYLLLKPESKAAPPGLFTGVDAQ